VKSLIHSQLPWGVPLVHGPISEAALYSRKLPWQISFVAGEQRTQLKYAIATGRLSYGW